MDDERGGQNGPLELGDPVAKAMVFLLELLEVGHSLADEGLFRGTSSSIADLGGEEESARWRESGRDEVVTDGEDEGELAELFLQLIPTGLLGR